MYQSDTLILTLESRGPHDAIPGCQDGPIYEAPEADALASEISSLEALRASVHT
jgi:hypothetical protein